MAKKSCDNPVVDIPVCFCGVSLIAALVLLISGFHAYRIERPKELHYKEDVCLVLAYGYRNETCQMRHSKYQCFPTTWDVQLEKEFTSPKTTVESRIKYGSLNETLANAVEYQVCSI